MNVIEFPTSEKRREARLKKTCQENTDFFDEPIKSEVMQDLMSYIDRFLPKENFSISFECEQFTESQSRAIQNSIQVFLNNYFIEQRLMIMDMMGVIVELRYKQATCQMLHGEQQE